MRWPGGKLVFQSNCVFNQNSEFTQKIVGSNISYLKVLGNLPTAAARSALKHFIVPIDKMTSYNTNY